MASRSNAKLPTRLNATLAIGYLREGNGVNLTDDEIGMLYWLREFPNRSVTVDATIWKLIAKGLVNYEDGRVSVTAAGVLWPELSEPK